ncbi:hypothetical protein [Vibrio salinus]|uniref:hypothetical protein n=1 Tax=Vibrio salinus TaxID=2899784 RepID=UPI001E295DE4|nr:hypothetical protein [Vibrio salinus]MCE0495447.1 hypothetical protein [Vibrio salinus]
MTRKFSEKDQQIIQLLQQQGFIKKEAKEVLKNQVYRLSNNDIVKINNYAQHFGITAKEKLIKEILELRRDALLEKNSN